VVTVGPSTVGLEAPADGSVGATLAFPEPTLTPDALAPGVEADAGAASNPPPCTGSKLNPSLPDAGSPEPHGAGIPPNA
jgi:hypothetical protein